MKTRLVVLFVLILLFLLLVSDSSFKKSPFYLEIKGKRLWLELANTEERRARGLMWRQDLGQDQGMLFIFPEEDYLSFWMKNTFIPLSIAFIDKQRTIVQIKKMSPDNGEKRYYSNYLVKYALEVNQGWFEKNGIGVGEEVQFSPAIDPF